MAQQQHGAKCKNIRDSLPDNFIQLLRDRKAKLSQEITAIQNTSIKSIYVSTRGRPERAMLLLYGYIRELQLMYSKSAPMDVMNLCLEFFFTPFDSSIISSDKDVDDFFELILQKISMERIKKAKLLFKGTRDGLSPFPYDKLAHNGPYLFVIESRQGHVFGGYCSVNIQKTNRELNWLEVKDEEIFLWVLKGVTLSKKKPYIYDVESLRLEILFDSNGRWFQFGEDLKLYDTMDAYHYCDITNPIHMYYGFQPRYSLLGTSKKYRFQMAEIEIFSIPVS